MKWREITGEADLEDLIKRSYSTPQIIFKHSTRCGVSSMAKNRLEKASAPAGVDFNHLDLIRLRSISNKIAEDFRVTHESPQVLLIKNGECVYDESHSGIRMDDIAEHITIS